MIQKEKIVAIHIIYGPRSNILLFYDPVTPILINKKYKIVYIDQYLPIEFIKGST